MEIAPVVKVYINDKEREACKIVDRMLSQLWNALDDTDILISTETGEGIEIKEIPLYRGLLTGLAERPDWEVHERS